MQTTLFIVMFYSVKTQFLMLLVLLEDFYSALLELHGTQGFSGSVYRVNVIFTQVLKDPKSVKEMRNPTSLVSWEEIVKHGGLNSCIFKWINFNSLPFLLFSCTPTILPSISFVHQQSSSSPLKGFSKGFGAEISLFHHGTSQHYLYSSTPDHTAGGRYLWIMQWSTTWDMKLGLRGCVLLQGFFHLSAAKQELNNMVQRVLPFQGDCGSQSERTSAKWNYGHNNLMHALKRGSGNVTSLGERKEINENWNHGTETTLLRRKTWGRHHQEMCSYCCDTAQGKKGADISILEVLLLNFYVY